MKKFICRLLLTVIAVMSFLNLPSYVLANGKDIIILHTNDIHCGIEDNIGMAAVAQYKKELSADNYVLLVDSGDAVQGAPIGALSQGAAIIRVMNKAEYDFAIPGNHEFDYGMDRFRQLSEMLDCGYYSANLIDRHAEKLLLPAFKIVNLGEIRLGIIGVTTPETLVSSTPAYFQDEQGNFIYGFYEGDNGKNLYRQIQAAIDEVRGQGAEYVFLVAHLGVNGSLPCYSSVSLIRNTSGLTAVLDGHSHEQLAGIVVKDKAGKNVLLGQTGTKLQKIGKLTLSADGNISYELQDNITDKNTAVADIIAQEKAVYAPLLQEPVGMSAASLAVNDPVSGKRMVRCRECSMGDFVADAYRAVLGADAVIVNGGGIRSGLPAGNFNYHDVLKVLTFGNMCMVIEVTGQQLLDALELGAADYPQESGAFLQVSGIKYTIDSSVSSAVRKDEQGNFIGVKGKYRVQDVIVGGKPLVKNKKYALGGTSYILKDGGNGMSMFKGARVLREAAICESDAFIEYVQNHLNAVIGSAYADPYGTGRIIIK